MEQNTLLDSYLPQSE